MTKKSPMRTVIEELLEHNEHVNVQNVCEQFFGYDRTLVSKTVYEIKGRVVYKSIHDR